MPTFEDAVADAAEAQQAIRGLAHAMQGMSDPSQGYPVLGSLTWGLASLEFALAQLARFYETTARELAEVHGDRAAGRASAQRVAEHLRAAGESVARAVESVTYAHNADSEISYAPPTVVTALSESPQSCFSSGFLRSGCCDQAGVGWGHVSECIGVLRGRTCAAAVRAQGRCHAVTRFDRGR